MTSISWAASGRTRLTKKSRPIDSIVNGVPSVLGRSQPARRARALLRTRLFSRSVITVENSGTGIDPKDFDSIIEPFFTTKSNRMGMGLSICWSIIANHGGRLAVAHGQPNGSIFQVFLPL